MSIVVFSRSELKETGQSLAISALATYMAIEHNQKMLIVATDFNDNTLEDCFWQQKKEEFVIDRTLALDRVTTMDSGVEGLIKIVSSSKTSPEIVRNYSKVVLRDRLDILVSPDTKSRDEYNKIATSYASIIQTANRFYDYVFVDLDNKMNLSEYEQIMQLADVIVLTLTQNLRCINNFVELKNKNHFYNNKKIIPTITRYDRYSKYNRKNVSRYLKEKKLMPTISYNTLFSEACSEGKIVDYFLKMRNVKADETDRNKIFIYEIAELSEYVLEKIKDVQNKRV